MVKVPVVPTGNSRSGKTYQFVQKRHRDAFNELARASKPTESKLKALERLGVTVDYGDAVEDSTSLPNPDNAV